MTAAEASGAPASPAGRKRVGTAAADPAPETRRGYAADWRDFLEWCRQHRTTPLPATAAALAAYLLDAAPAHRRGTLGRRRAAIRAMHRLHGFPLPDLDPAARAAVRAALRVSSGATAASGDAAPASPRPALHQLAASCPPDLAGLRDRALLLLASALGCDRRWSSFPGPAIPPPPVPVSRALLLLLDVEHVRFESPGVTLQLKQRADADTPDRVTHLPRAVPPHATCPVRALEAWLQASDTRFGPVFRKIDRWGNVEHDRLGPDAWRRILARRTGTKKRRRSGRKSLG